MCLANMPRWAYSQDRKACVQFIYGGCGGNRNRFLSETDCSDRCGSQSGTTQPEVYRDDEVCKSYKLVGVLETNLILCSIMRFFFFSSK